SAVRYGGEQVDTPIVQANAMAIDGNTLVLGGQLDGTDYGVAYVYQWDGTAWQETAKLYPDDRGAGGQGFGYAVAIEGNQILVGAPSLPSLDAINNATNDTVYTFKQTGLNWQQTNRFASAGTDLGRAVATKSGYLAMGAPEAGTSGEVSVYRLVTVGNPRFL